MPIPPRPEAEILGRAAQELVDGIAELDRRIAHHRKLQQMAAECHFTQLAKLITDDLARIERSRAVIVKTYRGAAE